ncbi:MAG: helix-turn-helix domain-containing protein, partial [bacterium]
MPRLIPLLSAALTVLRDVQGWHQNELAAALGCSPTLLSDYEAGRKTLKRERLEQFVAVMGLPPAAIDRAIAFVQEVRSLAVPEGGIAVRHPQAEAAVIRFKASAEAYARSVLSLGDEQRAAEERRKAPALWQRLERHSSSRRLLLVERSHEFRNWALCEFVCEISLKAAADSADQALELALLARRIAELAPGEKAWRHRLLAYALCHFANALRVGGQLPAADDAFAQAKALWEASGKDAPEILSGGRVLSLEASLRIDQRRLPEALELINRALPAALEGERKNLLLQLEHVLNLSGDFEGAIIVLQEISQLVSQKTEPRVFYGVQFNLTVNLVEAGRPEEAESFLRGLRELAARLGNGLDELRLRWLEGRVAAGLGRTEEALVSLAWVREEFTTRRIAYDAALATLDLAVLYLATGRISETRMFARRLVWVFEDHGVH